MMSGQLHLGQALLLVMLTSPLAAAGHLRYQAVMAGLRLSIDQGQYAPGEQLPSIRQLCAFYQASAATIIHALHLLEDMAIIEARPRLGFFVRVKRAAYSGTEVETETAALQPIALEGHRKLLMDLDATNAGCVSLSGLGLDEKLLPANVLKRLLNQLLRQQPALVIKASTIGDLPLRTQLSRRLQTLGCPVEADAVVVTQGATEAAELCLRVLTRPGDIVVVSAPGPMRMLQVMQALGLQVVEIPVHPVDGVSLVALEMVLRKYTVVACLVEPNFDNPTGCLMPDESKAALVSLARKHAVALIEIDTCGDLPHFGPRPRPLKAFDPDDCVLYCGSLYGIVGPAFGLGFVVNTRYQPTLKAARLIHGERIAALVQDTLAAFLGSGQVEPHLRRLRVQLAKQFVAYRSSVLLHFPAGTRIANCLGGTQLWVELPDQMNASALLACVVKEGYFFVPGTAFSLHESFDHCLRLSAARPLDAIRAKGIQLIGQIACQMAVAQSDSRGKS